MTIETGHIQFYYTKHEEWEKDIQENQFQGPLGGPAKAPSAPVLDPVKVSFLIFRVLTVGLTQTFFLDSDLFISAYSDAK